MNCPVDGTQLALAERQGIEIDYCPQCRGVWLDRGELDKIIERADGGGADRDRDDRRDRGDDHKRFGGKKRKRESLLGELFDFG